MRFVKRDENPQITCNLSGYISKGVVPSSEIKCFAIHRRYRNGTEWSSYGNPLVGYMYFFRHNGRGLVDIQLLSRWSADNRERHQRRTDLTESIQLAESVYGEFTK